MRVNRGTYCFAQPGPPNHLRAYRALIGKTQADLATALGCSIALISKIERGILRPTPDTAGRLAVTLGFHPHQVFPEREVAHAWGQAGPERDEGEGE